MLDMHEFLIDVPKAASRSKVFQRQACPVCTFENHPSMTACEMCGTALQPRGPSLVRLQPAEVNRGASPILDGNMKTKGRMLSRNPESIKLSFRAGGEKPFLLKLREALVQRKWILKNAPDISLARTSTSSPYPSSTPGSPVSSIPPTKPQNVGIASILAQNEQTRLKTQTIIGDAFADLEHLMASAKEVIDLAESFQRMNPNNNDPSSPSAPNTNTLDPTQALSLLGLRNNDPSRSSTASATAYTHSLARTLSDFLTSSSPHPLLHREGGIITLVDLWAVFNRARGGVALVSPQELRDAVECFEALKLPVRVRRFKSGLLAVRGVEWGDGRVVERIMGVIGDAGSGEGERLEREAVERVAWRGEVQGGEDGPAAVEGEEEERQGRERQLLERFGVGITAQQLASRLGWSVGVADEELAMAEERGAVCREEGVEGVRWWVNHFLDDYG